MSDGFRAVFLSLLLVGLISCSDNDDDGDQTTADDDGSTSVDTSLSADSPGSSGIDEPVTGDDGPSGSDSSSDAGTEVSSNPDSDNTTSNSPTPSPTSSSYFGVVVLADAAIEADFFSYPASADVAATTDPGVLASRLCRTSGSIDIAALQVAPSVAMESVSAGDVIVLTGEYGTYVELQRLSDAVPGRYAARVNVGEIGILPDELHVDIPGRDFPAFAQIDVPGSRADANGENDAGDDAQANSSASATSNSELNPDGQTSRDADVSISVAGDGGDALSSESVSTDADGVSIGRVSCTTGESVGDDVSVDTTHSVVVKKVQRGNTVLLVLRLVT